MNYQNVIQDGITKVKAIKPQLFRDIKLTTDNVMVTCPFHKGGQESKPSFGINIHTLSYHCFTCGESGNFQELIFKLIKYKLNVNVPMIKKGSKLTLLAPKKQRMTTELLDIGYTIGLTRYLQNRGITAAVCEEYIVGYRGNEVIFPIRDITGKIIFYVSRDVNDKIYQLSATVKPVYGLYEYSRNKRPGPVFIVESPINALTLAGWGYNAVALMGTGSNAQIETLRNLSSVKHYVLALDGDEAGYRASQRLKDKLRNKLVSCIIMYTDKDVNDLSEFEFKELYNEHKKVYHCI